MGAQLDRLSEEALQLAPAERRKLVAKLMDSLEQEVQGDHDAEWAALALNRLEGIRAGERTTTGWAEVRAGLLDK